MKKFDKMMGLIKEHKKELNKRFGVKKIGVFGSYAKRKETPKSDIDIYVEFNIEELTFDKYMELLKYLEHLLGRKIDIITQGGVETIRVPYIKEDIKNSVVYA